MKNIVIALLGVAFLVLPAMAQAHQATLTWTISVDDNTTQCAAPNTCSQTVYRAPGACSSSSAFVALSSAVTATTATYVDTTIVPGNWCYAVSFTLNGVESAKSTYGVVLQPAPPMINSVVVQ